MGKVANLFRTLNPGSWFGSKKRLYIFLGPPESGKTVYFAAVIDRLQRLAAQGKSCKLIASNLRALQFIDGVVGELQNQRWPPNTMGSEIYELEFEKRWLGMPFRFAIQYVDNKGEYFYTVFGDPKTYGEPGEDGQTLRQDVCRAHGVFLIVDAIQLHNGVTKEFRDSLFELTRFLRSHRNGQRIAVVFTKKDHFAQVAFDPEERLREDHPNSWMQLEKLNRKFFFVSAVKEPDRDKNGDLVPPKGWTSAQSLNLLEPVSWMLGIDAKKLNGDTRKRTIKRCARRTL